MIPRSRERVGGALIGVLSGALTGYVWQVAQTGRPFPRIGVAAPGFVVIGVALVLFPGYRRERLARGESLEDLDGLALLTPRWIAVLVVALAASLGFFALLKYG